MNGTINRFDTMADGSTPRGAMTDEQYAAAFWAGRLEPVPSSPEPQPVESAPSDTTPSAEPHLPEQAFPSYFDRDADPARDAYLDHYRAARAAMTPVPVSRPVPARPLPVHPYPVRVVPMQQAPVEPLAVASLVLGIMGLVFYVTAPIGLAVGILALRRTPSLPTHSNSRGMAAAGIATSAFGTLLVALFMLMVMAA